MYFDLKFPEVVPKGPITNNPELFQMITWHQTGNKSLLEAMMAQFPDTYTVKSLI